MSRKRGQPLFTRRRLSEQEHVYEGTTVVGVVRDHGNHYVYEVRVGGITVWSRLVYAEENERTRYNVSYAHDVICDRLAAKQRPDLHGRLSSTVSARQVPDA